MKFTGRVLLAIGLILTQLFATVTIATTTSAHPTTASASEGSLLQASQALTTALAHNKAPVPTSASTNQQPHLTSGNPSWRDFSFRDFNPVEAMVAQGNFLWISLLGSQEVIKWDSTTKQTVATYSPNNSGLPNVPTTITVDSNNNIWFGFGPENPVGLTKFDGTNWQTYNIANSLLPSNAVTALAADNFGNIWIGTTQGVTKFNGSSWQTFTSSNSDLYSNNILSLIIDKNSNVWAGAARDGICDSSNPIAGTLNKFDGNTWTSYAPPPQNATCVSVTYGLTTDKNGNVWTNLVASNSCPQHISICLAKFDGSNWQVFSYSFTTDDALLHGLSIVADNSGNIWLPSANGLVEFDGINWQTFQHLHKNELPYYPEFQAIVLDANGNKWLGGSFLSKFNQTDAMLTPNTNALDFNVTQGSNVPAKAVTFFAYNTIITYSTAVSYTSNATGWLNVAPVTNTISANSSQDITFSVDTTNLQAGVYTANLTITDQNDSTDTYTVAVVLRVGYIYYLPNLEGRTDTSANFSSKVIVQNTSTNPANVVFEFNPNSTYGINISPEAGCNNLAPLAQCIIPQLPTGNDWVQGIVTSNQPLSIIAISADSINFGRSANATSQTGSQLIAPLMLNDAFGSFYTFLHLFNAGSTYVTATVQYYDQNGNVVPKTNNLLMPPYQSSSPQNQLPTNFVGWAKITGSPNSNMVGQVVESNVNGFSAAFNTGVAPSSTLYAPTIFNNAFGGYATGASIVNPNANPVSVTITYYDSMGKASSAAPFTIQPQAIASIYQGNSQGKTGVVGIPNGGLPQGFYGSAIIKSQGGGVAMIVNEIGPASNNVLASGSYTARPAGSSNLTLPIICNGGYGYTTGLTVLNTSATTVNATIQYFNTNGTPLKNANGSPITVSFSVAAHGSYPIYQGAVGLPNNFYGLAVVTTSSGPANSLIATTNAISSDNFYTYTEPEM